MMQHDVSGSAREVAVTVSTRSIMCSLGLGLCMREGWGVCVIVHSVTVLSFYISSTAEVTLLSIGF